MAKETLVERKKTLGDMIVLGVVSALMTALVGYLLLIPQIQGDLRVSEQRLNSYVELFNTKVDAISDKQDIRLQAIERRLAVIEVDIRGVNRHIQQENEDRRNRQ